MSEQGQTLSQGFHIVVATPGRLQDMLEKKKFNLIGCKYLCLDEVHSSKLLPHEMAATDRFLLFEPG